MFRFDSPGPIVVLCDERGPVSPHFRREIVIEIISKIPKPYYYLSSQGWSKLFQDEQFLDHVIAGSPNRLVRQGRARVGSDLVVMTIPTAAMLEAAPSVHGKAIDATYPDKQIRVMCEKLSVPLICLKDVLARQDYKRWDEHWNERGHQEVARTLSAFDCNQAGIGIRIEERRPCVSPNTDRFVSAPQSVVAK